MLILFHRVGGKSGAMMRCKTCSGRGVKVTLRQLGPGMVQQMQSVCPDCHGEGIVDLILFSNGLIRTLRTC